MTNEELAAKDRELVLRVVNGYEFVSKALPSAWIVFSDDYKRVEGSYKNRPDICHAAMGRHTANSYDQLVTGVPRDQPLDLAYITYLIDGPFKSFRDRISLETIETEGRLKYYLRCIKLDTWPANVLYNFCIATRVPIEYPLYLPFWAKLTAAGVHEGLAFLLAMRFGYYDNWGNSPKPNVPDTDPWTWKFDALTVPGGHFWFDTISDWKPILDGAPLVNKFTTNYKANPAAVRPCNVIWGMANRGVTAKYLSGKTVKEISDYFGFTKADVNPDTVDKLAEFKIVEDPQEVFFDDDDDDGWDDDDVDDGFIEIVFDDDFIDDDFDDL